MTGPLVLSDNHRRRIGSTIRTFLETADDIEVALDLPPADGPLALFDGDLEPSMVSRFLAELQEIRLQVRELAKLCGIAMRPLSVRRRVSASASYAWTVAEELTPGKLAGSGEIDAAAAEQISERAKRLAVSFHRLAQEVEDAAGDDCNETRG